MSADGPRDHRRSGGAWEWELVSAKARYCRLLDTKDWPALADMLAENVTVDLDAGNPASVLLVGRESVIAALQAGVEGARTVHQVHLPEISIDGDVADVVWPVQERVIWSNGTSLTAFGHYRDTWRRERDRWLLEAMRLSHLLMEFSSED